MIFLLIGVVVLVMSTLFLVGAYNRLVACSQTTKQTWANISVVLKQRHDEIPRLVQVCEKYSEFEKNTLAEVISLRNSAVNHLKNFETEQTPANMNELKKSIEKLNGSLATVYAVSEKYPELKTNNNFMQLQTRISELENTVSDRRETYNDACRTYNALLLSIPYNMVASFGNFAESPYLSYETKDVEEVKLFNA